MQIVCCCNSLSLWKFPSQLSFFYQILLCYGRFYGMFWFLYCVGMLEVIEYFLIEFMRYMLIWFVLLLYVMTHITLFFKLLKSHVEEVASLKRYNRLDGCFLTKKPYKAKPQLSTSNWERLTTTKPSTERKLLKDSITRHFHIPKQRYQSATENRDLKSQLYYRISKAKRIAWKTY